MAAPFQHVLVATDGAPLADKGMALALRVASGSRVTALTVVYDYGLPEYVRAAVQRRPDAQELHDALIAGGRRLLGDAIARAAPAGQTVERRVLLSEKAACHEIVALGGAVLRQRARAGGPLSEPPLPVSATAAPAPASCAAACA